MIVDEVVDAGILTELLKGQKLAVEVNILFKRTAVSIHFGDEIGARIIEIVSGLAAHGFDDPAVAGVIAVGGQGYSSASHLGKTIEPVIEVGKGAVCDDIAHGIITVMYAIPVGSVRRLLSVS